MSALDRSYLSSQKNAQLSQYVTLLQHLMSQYGNTIARVPNSKLTLTQEKYMSRIDQSLCRSQHQR
jgi:hypothetical protein